LAIVLYVLLLLAIVLYVLLLLAIVLYVLLLLAIVLYVLLLLAIVLYVLLLLVIVLYVLLRFTASDYLFGIFKIFLAENKALFVAKQNNEKQRQNKSRNVWEWIKNIVILVCLVWLIVHVA
jgi:hypothetical protein